MELATGVHSLAQTVARDGRTVTIHPAVVETPTGAMLVDVGFEGALETYTDALAEAGFDLTDVTGVLVTHQDGDHAGALSEVVDRTGAVVYAHRKCAPYVDGRRAPIKAPESERYPPADVDVELVGGTSFRTAAGPMEVVFTPGHAPGHVSLHFPEAALVLAADALTVEAGRLRGPSEQFTPEPDRALDSARRLAERDVEQVLCFHGGAVDVDSERIREVVDTAR